MRASRCLCVCLSLFLSLPMFFLFSRYFGFWFLPWDEFIYYEFYRSGCVFGHAKTVTNGLDRLFKIATTLRSKNGES